MTPKWKPAKNIKEAKKRFKDLGINEVSNPAFSNVPKWGDKEFIDEVLNPVLKELERISIKFPAFSKALKGNKLKGLEIYKSQVLPRGFVGDIDVLGTYKSDFEKILMAMTNSSKWEKPLLSVSRKSYTVGEDFKYVFRHELGHHFQDSIIQSDDVILNAKGGNFFKLWKKVGIDKDGSFNSDISKSWFKKNVSEYSGTNSAEAFAESFSAYTSSLYKRGMLPKQVEKYFDDLIGKE